MGVFEGTVDPLIFSLILTSFLITAEDHSMVMVQLMCSIGISSFSIMRVGKTDMLQHRKYVYDMHGLHI